jgi:hypothetical protein
MATDDRPSRSTRCAPSGQALCPLLNPPHSPDATKILLAGLCRGRGVPARDRCPPYALRPLGRLFLRPDLRDDRADAALLQRSLPAPFQRLEDGGF